MSLTAALNLSIAGLRASSTEVSVTTQNITNAEKEGYSKKIYQSNNITTANYTFPAGGRSVGLRNAFLQKELISDASIAFRDQVIADYLNQYQQLLGSPGAGNSLSSLLSDLNTKILALSSDPNDPNVKFSVIERAEQIASNIRDTHGTIQDLRQDAENKIGQTVDRINASLEAIFELNKKIVSLDLNPNAEIANFEDLRLTELSKLSQLMDVNYFVNDQNEIRILLKDGTSLINSVGFKELNFAKVSNVTKDLTYPATLNGVTLGGIDVTSQITTGELAAYFQVRDGILVEEQAKLDELAIQLRNSVNAATNQGTASPPRSEITGDTLGLTAADPVTTSGAFRVTTTNANGIAVGITDININPTATVGDIVNLLNAIPTINASLNANGQLSITTVGAAAGVAFNELDSQVEGIGLSHFFGLNNLFDGVDSRNINVSDYLQQNSAWFPGNYLTENPVFGIGDIAIAIADNTSILTISESLTQKTSSFSAAGNFGAQVNSLVDYAAAFTANAASRAASAELTADITTTSYETIKNSLESETGVNMDEETARLLELENNYQSAAIVMQTIRTLFESLLASVR